MLQELENITAGEKNHDKIRVHNLIGAHSDIHFTNRLQRESCCGQEQSAVSHFKYKTFLFFCWK